MVRLQNGDSLDRYIAYVKRFMCYLLRIRVAQKERAVLEGNVDGSIDGELVDDNEEFSAEIIGEESEIQQIANSDQVERMKDCCEVPWLERTGFQAI